MTRELHMLRRIYAAARQSDDRQRCMVSASPELRAKIKTQLETMRSAAVGLPAPLLRFAEPRRPGFNDGIIHPPSFFPPGTAPALIRSAAALRSPLRGVLRVVVVLVDFADQPMAQNQAHFRELFFSTGTMPTKSVREYFADVTHGLVDIQGEVVGPFRLPRTMAEYANGKSGIGGMLPNAQTMARDAVLAADPSVDFTAYDNDGDGFVDAFVVVHAGAAAEVTGNMNEIWSHKWTVEGGPLTVDATRIFGYLTVPEDARIGVCCHELGHLLFGFPDLYDTDYSSEGIGDWCLMAGGSWGGAGNTPVHPSAWCKANQGWVSVNTVAQGSMLSIPDVKSAFTVFRLWKNGMSGNEYFLLENRQQLGFDFSLPGNGLLIWHVDDSIADNTDEGHFKVALMQADGRRDLEHARNRGDAGDPYPGATGNASFTPTSSPNSNDYSGASSCVSVREISASAPVMTAKVSVSCGGAGLHLQPMTSALAQLNARLTVLESRLGLANLQVAAPGSTDASRAIMLLN